jgi:3-dehydroquinate synthase
MKSIAFSGSTGNSRILLGANFDQLGELCDTEKTVIIVDRNVLEMHNEKLSPYQRLIEVEPGEQQKTLETVNTMYERFLEWELDRSSTVVGVGGGMVCDMSGFAASTYLRGIPFGFVPTTLLAMVDAGVGGKNGVNYHGYKNLVGTFSQPGFVLCDFAFLKTLPYDELKNGLAEAIKSALIADEALFNYIEDNKKEISLLDNDAIQRIVFDSLNVKIDIVSRDETERGERRKLNFGHTIGHAIEKAVKIPHGEAISIGMVASARLSKRKGTLTDEDVKRIELLLSYFQLPVKFKAERSVIMDAVRKDKKREGENIYFVLLNGIGSSRIETISIDELQEVLFDLC